MIKLKDLIREITDGQGYMTAEKFGSICLNQLTRTFPEYEVDLFDVADFIKDQVKYKMPKRVSIHNSSLRARFHIETNDKLYFVNIVNEFDKVPERELSNKFTMADDDYLMSMPSVSLEPKDLNTPNELMRFRCSMVLQDREGNTLNTLIPDHKTSSVYFTDYKTLNELILDVKTKIDEDKFNDLGKLDENEDEFDTSSLNSVKDITDIVKDDMVKVAQKQYDDWKQDQNGQDVEVGGGGICHLIADDLISVLYRHKIDNVQSVCSNYEQHVYIVGQFKEGIYEIDIPYNVYETGGGYSWKKIPDVEFNRNDIVISRLSSDPGEYNNYVDTI
jgi:hypothetical protein